MKITAGRLGIHLSLALTLLGTAGAQNTTPPQFRLPDALQLKLQTVPNFGAAPIFRMLDAASSTRFLNGNTLWLTAAGLDANRAAQTSMLNTNLNVLRGAPQQPGVQALLKAVSISGLREPRLTVPTARGPLTVRLQGADVGAAVLARAARENRAETGQAIVTELARRQNVGVDVIRQVAQASPAARAQLVSSVSASIDRLRPTLRPGAAITATFGTANGLDADPSNCSPRADSLFNRLDFPVKANLPAVKNQGGRGTCWAFATVGLVETVIQRDLKASVNLSEEDYVAYSKLMYGAPTDADGADTFWVMQKNAAANYRFAYENAWEYNKSLKRTETETPAKSGKWTYTQSCTDYPYKDQCEDTVSQAETGCILTAGQTVCGAQLPTKRTPYSLDTSNMRDFWDAGSPDGSLGWAALAVALGQPVMLVHDSRYLQYGAKGFVPDLPYSAVQHEQPEGSQKYVPNAQEDVHNWNHIALLVGYVSNQKLATLVPDAPAGAGGGYFILRNSWSSCWGDGGYVYLPWNWMKKYTGGLYIGGDVRKN